MQDMHVRSGPRVGKQTLENKVRPRSHEIEKPSMVDDELTETIPTAHSMIHQAQAVASVQVVSDGTNWNKVVKR